MAAIGVAQQLYTLPVSLFGMAISAAELPEMSRATGDELTIATALRIRLDAATQRLAFYIVPSAVAFLAIGDILIGFLFQSGRFDAEATRVCELARDAGDPAGAQILEADGDALAPRELQHREIRHDQNAFEEGVGHLHRTLVLRRGGVVEIGARKRGSAHARPIGGLADQEDVVGLVVCLLWDARTHHVLLFDQAHGDDVHQTVVVVTVV